VRAEHGIELKHVKITLTSEAVARVVAEKAAGRHTGGSIDLIWINGENFLALKEQGLLFGPFTQRLPNTSLVDTVGKPTTVIDFTVPVDGLESPWRMAQIVYAYDSARLQNPPRSIPAMVDWARRNPGRITHPRIRNFLGSTFLKQALHELPTTRGAAGAGYRGHLHHRDGASLALVRTAQAAPCGAKASSSRRPAPPCASYWRTARSTS
jgi:putative thiamine transport system substrate-binding protein